MSAEYTRGLVAGMNLGGTMDDGYTAATQAAAVAAETARVEGLFEAGWVAANGTAPATLQAAYTMGYGAGATETTNAFTLAGVQLDQSGTLIGSLITDAQQAIVDGWEDSDGDGHDDSSFSAGYDAGWNDKTNDDNQYTSDPNRDGSGGGSGVPDLGGGAPVI